MFLKVTNKKPVINRLVFDYLTNYKLTILIALLMMIISAAATGLHAWLVRPALDDVLIKGDKEMLFLIPIAIIILLFGVYPAPLINMIAPSMDGIIKIIQSAI